MLPGTATRYADPATELEVTRLTDPAYPSILPPPHLRSVSRKQGFFVFTSAREGSLQVFSIDLKSFEWRRLSNSAAVDPATVTLTRDERSVLFFDGPVLKSVPAAGGAEKTLYQVPDGFSRTPGFGVSADGQSAIFAEAQAGRSQLRSLTLPRTKSTGSPAVRTLAEAAGLVINPMPRPQRAQVLYRIGNDLHLAGSDGKSKRLTPSASGAIGDVRWAPDGGMLQYLLEPSEAGQLVTLHELSPESGQDKLIGKTSNFAGFSANLDSSVFVGASRNKSSAYVLLLLRVTHREFSLCEHKASNPAQVQPRFSPDSQSIFFMSDRHGKTAIYRMRVEKLVEETDDAG